MPLVVANWVVWVCLGYLAVGLGFAVPFVLVGAGRIDPVAAKGSWGFRLLILPGSAALWPLLLVRWMRGSSRPVERNAHRDAAAHGDAAGGGGS